MDKNRCNTESLDPLVLRKKNFECVRECVFGLKFPFHFVPSPFCTKYSLSFYFILSVLSFTISLSNEIWKSIPFKFIVFKTFLHRPVNDHRSICTLYFMRSSAKPTLKLELHQHLLSIKLHTHPHLLERTNASPLLQSEKWTDDSVWDRSIVIVNYNNK